MQDLTPVGLSKDGNKLILISASGEEFSVSVDRKLRAALKGDPAGLSARIGQLEMKMESALRPRDIQNRIRGGESAEAVASAAGTTVDAIMGFAGPVLAEREHIAQIAQKASVRRRSSESPVAGRTLTEAGHAYLHDLGVRYDDVEWDSWRRDDGRWTLVASYAGKGKPRRAEFIYDNRGRFVVAENDEARMFTGELQPPAPAAQPASGRRLSSVPPSQDELPLGDDAIAMVRNDPALTDHADADWLSPAADPDVTIEVTEEVRVEIDVEVSPEEETTEIQRPASTPTPQSATEVEAPASEHEPEQAEAPAEPEPAEPVRPPRKRGRASVPSWDEIMFGGGKND